MFGSTLALAKLDSKAAKFVREINNELVTQARKLMEDLRDVKMEASDLKKSEVCNCFLGIQEHLSHFIEMVSTYETGNIAKKLATIFTTDPRTWYGRNRASLRKTVPHPSIPLNCLMATGKAAANEVLQTFLTGLHNIHFAHSYGELDASYSPTCGC